MSHDDEQCMRLGREVVRMVRDLARATGSDTGYARRGVTFPGGDFQILVVNDPVLADQMEAVADEKYAVQTVTPHSQRN